MYFDRRLWRLTRGMRWRIFATVFMGLASAAIGIARFVLLASLLALVFRSAPSSALILPAAAVAGAVLLRALLEHERTMIAHHTAARVQEVLRLKLYDKVTELGPAWFAGERTGAVMLSLVDGVEHELDGQRRVGADLPQNGFCAGNQLVPGHDLVDEANAVGFLRRDHPARQDQLQRQPLSDQPR